MSGAVIEPRTPSTPRTSAEYRSAGWRIVRPFTMQSRCSEAPPSRFVRTVDRPFERLSPKLRFYLPP